MSIGLFGRRVRYSVLGFALLGCMSLSATAQAVDIPPNAQLRLQMGVASQWGLPGAWVLETPGVPGSTTTILGPRPIVLKSKCVYDKAASENPVVVNGSPLPQLVELNATGGNGEVGVDPSGSGQGVFNGSRGTDCWRIESASNNSTAEVYKWKIGKSVKDRGFGLMVGISADVEVKGSAVLKLNVTANSSVVGSFFLQTGTNVGACIATNSDLLDDDGDGCVDSRFISQCFAGTSDSNPDSNDNCRWNIELDQNGVLGDGFDLTALSGEATLGGGNDFGVGATGTIIQLASGATGPFGCTPDVNDTTATVTNPATGLSCEAVRQEVNGVCTTVPYVIRADTGSCELIAVPPSGEQLVANVFVKFDPESQKTLDSGETLANLGAWKPADLSQISFGVPPNASGNFDIPPCLGVTLIGSEDPDGPLPIPEIRDGEITVDRIQDGSIEFACAFKRTETFICGAFDQSGTRCESPKTIVEEGIQFWGDAQFSRD